MPRSDRRKLEDIADDLMDSFPLFLRRASPAAGLPSGKRPGPCRFVLHAIMMHGPVRMSEIGRHMGISRPYMTALVDKLVDDGLVERVPDPNDRRAVLVRITEAGREANKDFARNTREVIVKNLSSLDSEDVEVLHELMKSIRVIVSKLDEKGA